MSILYFTRLFHFILSQGPDIVGQVEAFRSFVADLVEKYEGQQVAVSDKLFDDAAGLYSDIALNCLGFDEAESAGGAKAANASGAFRELFAWIIKNPQQVLDLIDTFKSLFGIQDAELAAQRPEPTTS